MKVNSFDSIKFSKPFKIFDIALYLFCAVFISAFLLGVAFVKKSPSCGFKAEINGKTVLSYYYEDKRLEIYDGFYSFVEKNGDFITIYSDEEKTAFNVLKIDDVNRSVSVTDANCSARKDCVHTAPLTKDGGVIICMPHKLKISPINTDYIPPVTN